MNAVIVVVAVAGVQLLGPEHQQVITVLLVGVGDHALVDHRMIHTSNGAAVDFSFHNPYKNILSCFHTPATDSQTPCIH